MDNEVKRPLDVLVEKEGLENATKWTEMVKQMLEVEKKESGETTVA